LTKRPIAHAGDKLIGDVQIDGATYAPTGDCGWTFRCASREEFLRHHSPHGNTETIGGKIIRSNTLIWHWETTPDATAHGQMAGQKAYIDSPQGKAAANRIRVLSAAGMSYHRIASRLNIEGVKTKRKGTRWHSQGVKNMLDSISGQRQRQSNGTSNNRAMTCIGIALPLIIDDHDHYYIGGTRDMDLRVTLRKMKKPSSLPLIVDPDEDSK
jgi:hypothetical protein